MKPGCVRLGVIAVVLLAAISAHAVALRVSVNSAGEPADAEAHGPAIDGHGQVVAFRSFATNLASPCTAGNIPQLFARDVVAGTTECVSVSTGGQAADADSQHPVLSGDGRFIAFTSQATNLDPICPFGGVFVRDRTAGTTTCASLDPGGYGVQGSDPSISADGHVVAFSGSITFPKEFPPCDFRAQPLILVRDLTAGTTTCASVGPGGEFRATKPSLSADGRRVLFRGLHEIPPCGAFENAYVRDLVAGTLTCVSLDGDGVPFDVILAEATLSGDGHTAVFDIILTGPAFEGDPPPRSPAPCPPVTSQTAVVLLRNLDTGTVTCLIDRPRLRPDGTSVFFSLSSASPSDDGTAIAVVSDDASVFCEARVYLLRPGAAPPDDRDCLSPIEGQIRVGLEVALARDGRRAAFSAVAIPSVAGVEMFLADVPTKAAPDLWVTVNQPSLRAGDTLVLTAFLTPGTAPSPVDAYVIFQIPGSNDLYSLTPGGFAFFIEPLVTGFTPFAFQGELLRFTLTGGEPPGDYYVASGLVAGGNVVGDLERAIFRILP